MRVRVKYKGGATSEFQVPNRGAVNLWADGLLSVVDSGGQALEARHNVVSVELVEESARVNYRAGGYAEATTLDSQQPCLGCGAPTARGLRRLGMPFEPLCRSCAPWSVVNRQDKGGSSDG